MVLSSFFSSETFVPLLHISDLPRTHLSLLGTVDIQPFFINPAKLFLVWEKVSTGGSLGIWKGQETNVWFRVWQNNDVELFLLYFILYVK